MNSIVRIDRNGGQLHYDGDQEIVRLLQVTNFSSLYFFNHCHTTNDFHRLLLEYARNFSMDLHDRITANK